jgi:hypothetical protein
MSDFDSPWKEALDHFLPAFLAFFFPEVHAGVDWSRDYEALDKELQQVAREGELGLRLADKLFRVWRPNGEEAWVLIHIEIQSQPDEEFAERMYVYNYRLYDRYRRPVVSLAVLGDERGSWRPNSFGYQLWGCAVRLDFPIAKLLDYARDLGALEALPNPFGLVVLAHLQTLATRRDPQTRQFWKTRLAKSLLNRGLEAAAIRQLFGLIDWMMDLPPELANAFSDDIRQFEEGRKMPYINSIERQILAESREEGRREGREEGREEGRQEGEILALRRSIALILDIKFGAAGLALLPDIAKLEDVSILRSLPEAIRAAATLEEVRACLP